MYQQVLAGYKKTLEPDHNFTLDTIKSMGEIYETQGDLDKAMMLYQEAWAGYGNTLGWDHDATLRVYRKIEEIIKIREGSNEQKWSMDVLASTGRQWDYTKPRRLPPKSKDYKDIELYKEPNVPSAQAFS